MGWREKKERIRGCDVVERIRGGKKKTREWEEKKMMVRWVEKERIRELEDEKIINLI